MFFFSNDKTGRGNMYYFDKTEKVTERKIITKVRLAIHCISLSDWSGQHIGWIGTAYCEQVFYFITVCRQSFFVHYIISISLELFEKGYYIYYITKNLGMNLSCLVQQVVLIFFTHYGNVLNHYWILIHASEPRVCFCFSNNCEIWFWIIFFVCFMFIGLLIFYFLKVFFCGNL